MIRPSLAVVAFFVLLFGLLGVSHAAFAQAESPGLSASLSAAPPYTCVTNVYIDGVNGNDKNSGTQANPWKTIQNADSGANATKPGECVNVLPGTYTISQTLTLVHGGNSNSATGYVVYRSTTPQAAHIIVASSFNTSSDLIEVLSGYFMIDGFELDGNNTRTSGNGVNACNGGSPIVHHFTALNNIIHDMGGAALASCAGDFVTFEHNVAYNTCATNPFEVSAFDLGLPAALAAGSYTPTAADNVPFHIVISYNIAHNNSEGNNGHTVHTDGNGIIVDTTFGSQTCPTCGTPYPFDILVLGNLSYSNGGAGINIFASENVTVANNTVYNNRLDLLNPGRPRGELNNGGSANITWVNNLAYAVPGSGVLAGNVPIVTFPLTNFPDTGTWTKNLTFGAANSTDAGNVVSAATNLVGVNPQLTNPAAANFVPLAGSPVIAAGVPESYIPAATPNIGAYSPATTAAPTVSSVSPSSGSTAGGTSVTVGGSGFTGATAVKFGTAAGTGLNVVNDGQITVTSPAGSAGAVDITVTTPNGTSSTTTSDKFDYVSVALPVAGAASATVAYESASDNITLNLSGGAAASVAIASQAAHGTATASGTAISYTPVTGYFGADSFTYKATNGAGTSSPATVSITVSAPTISVTPTALAGGTVGTPYNQSLAANGGQAPYAFATTVASGALPGGLALSSTGTISGTPTASGTFTFTVGGTDSSTTSHANFTSGTISLLVSSAGTATVSAISPSGGSPGGGNLVTIVGTNFTGVTAVMFGSTPATLFNLISATQISAKVPAGSGTVDVTVTTPGGTSATSANDHYIYLVPPTTTPVAATIAYDSLGNAISLGLGGGPASSVAVATAASHGTATASGTAIAYTPAKGYYGTDSFGYTATNIAGTSSPATVSITVPAPTISVTPTVLAGGAVGAAYSQSLFASGGQAPYGFSTSVASGALPGGLSLASNGTISGVPTAAGTFTFSVSGTDSSTATHASFTSGPISVTISPVGTPIVASISPSSGPPGGGTPVTITGTNLSGAIAVKFGGTAATSFAIVDPNTITATVPAGLVGTVAVTVTTPNGTSPAGLDAKFTYATPSAIGGQVYAYSNTIGVTGAANTDGSHFDKPVVGAVDTANGHLFVADTGNHRVQVIDTTSLAVVATIGISGVSGSDAAHLDSPGGVGFDAAAGHIIVADTGNQRLQIFDANSFAFLSTLGVTRTIGTDNEHFYLPTSAHVNPTSGQLYVADSGNHRIQIYTAGTLAYVGTIGVTATPGSDNTRFNQPRDAEFNPSANQIMVADSGNSRVQFFDANSFAYLSTIGGAEVSAASNYYVGTPVTAMFDPVSNLVLVADSGAYDRIQVFDAMSYRYVLTIGATGSSGTANSQFSGPVGLAADPAHARIFVGDTQNDRVQIFSIEPPVVFASVLPGSRSVQLGNPATVFASLINAGSTQLDDCQIALPATAPAGLSLAYQTTNPATNALTGTPDTPATIAPNSGLQTFLISFQGTAPFSVPGMPLDLDCDGVAPAAIAVGVDTVDLTVSSTPVVDVIALAVTPTNNGIVEVPIGGAGAFAVATTNLGAAGMITVSADTGTAVLPVTATVCQSNPSTGQCLASPTASLALSYGAQAVPTFSVFLQSSGAIAFSPAASRVFLRFKDASGGLHGSTSVAIETP